MATVRRDPFERTHIEVEKNEWASPSDRRRGTEMMRSLLGRMWPGTRLSWRLRTRRGIRGQGALSRDGQVDVCQLAKVEEAREVSERAAEGRTEDQTPCGLGLATKSRSSSTQIGQDACRRRGVRTVWTEKIWITISKFAVPLATCSADAAEVTGACILADVFRPLCFTQQLRVEQIERRINHNMRRQHMQ